MGGGARMAAVNTGRGLYLLDLQKPAAHLAKPFPDNRTVGTYHDLKWDPGHKLLYASGDQKRVDVYKFK